MIAAKLAAAIAAHFQRGMADAEALLVSRADQADNSVIGGDLFGLAAFLANEEGKRHIARPEIQRQIGVEAFDPRHKAE